MSQPSSQLSSSPPANGNQPGRPRYRIPRPLFWIVLFGFFIPYVVVQVPREIGRWHLASACQLRAKGEAESAYEELDAAAYWFPNSPELLLQRAEWKLKDGKKEEALAEAEQVVTAGKESYRWLIVHASFVQHAGDFASAVEDWKKIEQFSLRSGIPSRATALNGLAYAQALANVDVDEALKNVDEALELVPKEPNILDTRGFVYFRRGDYESALKDLDRAVKGLDDDLAVADEALGDETTPAGYRRAVDMMPKTLQEIYPVDAAAKRQIYATAAAVAHYHRSLALKALDRKEEAEKDWEIARKLIGREPDETLF
ncbi:MAG TPA: hypothetical protein VGI40_10670 [Pirellulaceae bacterium]|jgi:tetratricopeptide (TPR) repeat protein